jgi:hypothetical protein
VIAVATDGRVTLHVDQQPLDWVLEQIAQQAGYGARERIALPPAAARPESGTETRPVQAGEPGCTEGPGFAPAEASRLTAAITRGGEPERLQGLLAAASAGLRLPDALLRSVFESDASDRVRLAAFEQYLDALRGEPEALRDAIGAALHVPNAAIQRDARRRLDELDAVEPGDTMDSADDTR